jgi:mRNA interferase RelE/StbE
VRYQVEFLRRAARYYERLQPHVQRRIGDRIDQIAWQPEDPSLSIPLKARPGTWRARVGNLRIILDVREESRTLLVIDIGPRGDIYKN